MFTVNKIEDVFAPNVRNFEGFLACLIYSTAHRDFSRLVHKGWDALHRFSGKSVLILVADAPPEINTPPADEIPKYAAQWMTTFPTYAAGKTNELNADLIDHFSIKRAQMPCIVFF